jgi:hypothetical protein
MFCDEASDDGNGDAPETITYFKDGLFDHVYADALVIARRL